MNSARKQLQYCLVWQENMEKGNNLMWYSYSKGLSKSLCQMLDCIPFPATHSQKCILERGL